MSAAAKALDVTDEMLRLVESGDVEALACLLPRVVNINARNRHGATALMRAACCGHAQIVRLLLEHGADPNLTRNDKFTALALAAFFGHTELEPMRRWRVVLTLRRHRRSSREFNYNGTCRGEDFSHSV